MFATRGTKHNSCTELVDPHGCEIPLLVDNFVPYLRSGYDPVMAASKKARAPAKLKEASDDEGVPPPPAPLAGAEAEAKTRRDRRAEAKSLEHQLCHFPKNPYCPTCRQAKMMQKPARKTNKPESEKPQSFGQCVTGDHIICKRDVEKGINGETCALVVLDVATDWLACYPLKAKSAQAAYEALDDFEGPKRCVALFHSDNAPELIKAAKMIGWLHGKSTPGVHESNAIAESAARGY